MKSVLEKGSEDIEVPPKGDARDLLGMLDVDGDLDDILALAQSLKEDFKDGRPRPLLAGKSAVLIFEKSSTRTRVSFELGCAKLGMTTVFLSSRDIHLGKGSESVEDTAMTLSRYADVLVYRAFKRQDVADLAEHAAIPVVNALDDHEHPCQILADFLTLRERFGSLKGLRFLYVGDGANNVATSYLYGGALAGMHVTIAAPKGYQPDPTELREAQELAKERGGSVTLVDDHEGAYAGQDVVATDTWVSMGDEEEKETRLKAFQGWTVTEERFARAKPTAVFIHCLPAYYGYEVTKEVASGPRSLIWDEAENRMWAQMAAMVWLVSPKVFQAWKITRSL